MPRVAVASRTLDASKWHAQVVVCPRRRLHALVILVLLGCAVPMTANHRKHDPHAHLPGR